MVFREILYGLAGNFIFSLCLFTYNKYNHKHYDEIIERLIRIEEYRTQQLLLENYNASKDFTTKDNFTPKEYYKK